jgi:hypothetical protein
MVLIISPLQNLMPNIKFNNNNFHEWGKMGNVFKRFLGVLLLGVEQRLPLSDVDVWPLP